MKLSDFVKKESIEFHCPYPSPNDQPDWFVTNPIDGITIQRHSRFRRFRIDLRVISYQEVSPMVTVESHRKKSRCFDGCILIYFALPDVTFLECHLSPFLVEGKPMAMVRVVETVYY